MGGGTTIYTTIPKGVQFNVQNCPDGIPVLQAVKQRSYVYGDAVLVTRNFWARELGVNVKTFKRREESLINAPYKLAYYYWDLRSQERQDEFEQMGRVGYRLNHYQRFLQLFLHLLWRGDLTYGIPLKHGQMLQWLNEPIDGGRTPRWMYLTKPEFDKYKVKFAYAYTEVA